VALTEIKVITNCRLIDGTGKSPLENVSVLIEDAKIKTVGQDIEIPKEAQVIDARGKTVMPGMIDAHRHFNGMLADDTEIDTYSRSRELRLIKAVFDAQKTLVTGFTTIRDCGGMNGIFLKQAAANHILTGVPRILAAGYQIENMLVNHQRYLPLKYVDARTSRLPGKIGGAEIICDGVDECIKATRYNLRLGADFIKVVSWDDLSFNLDELKAIVRTAGEVNKCVTTHTDTAKYAKSAILAGVKTIDHAVGMDEEAVEMANKSGVVFISTLVVMQAIIDYGVETKRQMRGREWAKGMLEKMVQGYRKIHRLGGTMAVGTDIGGENLLENVCSSAFELELLVNYCDYTPMEAIIAATKNGALACFMGDKLGTIEPGKLADIIMVDGNPLSNIRILKELDKIKMVMLEGKIQLLSP
jgi:imidazolonepropionase-like amidohydrolase